MINRISALIKEANKKTIYLASGDVGKISRIMRLESGEIIIELKSPNGEISLENFYAFAFDIKNENIFQECQEIDCHLSRITNYKNITIF